MAPKKKGSAAKASASSKAIAAASGKGATLGAGGGAVSELEEQCKKLLATFAKGVAREKVGKQLQAIATKYPDSHLPHRYMARMLQHDAVYVLGEFSKELGTKRLGLFERAFEAAYTACNLCPASMAAAELLAGITLQYYYERAMLVRWGHAPPDPDADEAVLKLALATDRVHVTCDLARQGNELKVETVIVVSHGKDERTVDPCMQNEEDKAERKHDGRGAKFLEELAALHRDTARCAALRREALDQLSLQLDVCRLALQGAGDTARGLPLAASVAAAATIPVTAQVLQERFATMQEMLKRVEPLWLRKVVLNTRFANTMEELSRFEVEQQWDVGNGQGNAGGQGGGAIPPSAPQPGQLGGPGAGGGVNGAPGSTRGVAGTGGGSTGAALRKQELDAAAVRQALEFGQQFGEEVVAVAEWDDPEAGGEAGEPLHAIRAWPKVDGGAGAVSSKGTRKGKGKSSSSASAAALLAAASAPPAAVQRSGSSNGGGPREPTLEERYNSVKGYWQRLSQQQRSEFTELPLDVAMEGAAQRLAAVADELSCGTATTTACNDTPSSVAADSSNGSRDDGGGVASGSGGHTHALVTYLSQLCLPSAPNTAVMRCPLCPPKQPGDIFKTPTALCNHVHAHHVLPQAEPGEGGTWVPIHCSDCNQQIYGQHFRAAGGGARRCMLCAVQVGGGRLPPENDAEWQRCYSVRPKCGDGLEGGQYATQPYLLDGSDGAVRKPGQSQAGQQQGGPGSEPGLLDGGQANGGEAWTWGLPDGASMHPGWDGPDPRGRNGRRAATRGAARRTTTANGVPIAGDASQQQSQQHQQAATTKHQHGELDAAASESEELRPATPNTGPQPKPLLGTDSDHSGDGSMPNANVPGSSAAAAAAGGGEGGNGGAEDDDDDDDDVYYSDYYSSDDAASISSTASYAADLPWLESPLEMDVNSQPEGSLHRYRQDAIVYLHAYTHCPDSKLPLAAQEAAGDAWAAKVLAQLRRFPLRFSSKWLKYLAQVERTELRPEGDLWLRWLYKGVDHLPTDGLADRLADLDAACPRLLRVIRTCRALGEVHERRRQWTDQLNALSHFRARLELEIEGLPRRLNDGIRRIWDQLGPDMLRDNVEGVQHVRGVLGRDVAERWAVIVLRYLLENMDRYMAVDAAANMRRAEEVHLHSALCLEHLLSRDVHAQRVLAQVQALMLQAFQWQMRRLKATGDAHDAGDDEDRRRLQHMEAALAQAPSGKGHQNGKRPFAADLRAQRDHLQAQIKRRQKQRKSVSEALKAAASRVESTALLIRSHRETAQEAEVYFKSMQRVLGILRCSEHSDHVASVDSSALRQVDIMDTLDMRATWFIPEDGLRSIVDKTRGEVVAQQALEWSDVAMEMAMEFDAVLTDAMFQLRRRACFLCMDLRPHFALKEVVLQELRESLEAAAAQDAEAMRSKVAAAAAAASGSSDDAKAGGSSVPPPQQDAKLAAAAARRPRGAGGSLGPSDDGAVGVTSDGQAVHGDGAVADGSSPKAGSGAKGGGGSKAGNGNGSSPSASGNNKKGSSSGGGNSNGNGAGSSSSGGGGSSSGGGGNGNGGGSSSGSGGSGNGGGDGDGDGQSSGSGAAAAGGGPPGDEDDDDPEFQEQIKQALELSAREYRQQQSSGNGKEEDKGPAAGNGKAKPGGGGDKVSSPRMVPAAPASGAKGGAKAAAGNGRDAAQASTSAKDDSGGWQQTGVKTSRSGKLAAAAVTVVSAATPAVPAAGSSVLAAAPARPAINRGKRDIYVHNYAGDWCCVCDTVNPFERKQCRKCSGDAPCKDYTRGTCEYKNCRFVHAFFDTPLAPGPPNREPVAFPGPDAKLWADRRVELEHKALAAAGLLPKQQAGNAKKTAAAAPAVAVAAVVPTAQPAGATGAATAAAAPVPAAAKQPAKVLAVPTAAAKAAAAAAAAAATPAAAPAATAAAAGTRRAWASPAAEQPVRPPSSQAAWQQPSATAAILGLAGHSSSGGPGAAAPGAAPAANSAAAAGSVPPAAAPAALQPQDQQRGPAERAASGGGTPSSFDSGPPTVDASAAASPPQAPGTAPMAAAVQQQQQQPLSHGGGPGKGGFGLFSSSGGGPLGMDSLSAAVAAAGAMPGSAGINSATTAAAAVAAMQGMSAAGGGNPMLTHAPLAGQGMTPGGGLGGRGAAGIMHGGPGGSPATGAVADHPLSFLQDLAARAAATAGQRLSTDGLLQALQSSEHGGGGFSPFGGLQMGPLSTAAAPPPPTMGGAAYGQLGQAAGGGAAIGSNGGGGSIGGASTGNGGGTKLPQAFKPAFQ